MLLDTNQNMTFQPKINPKSAEMARSQQDRSPDERVDREYLFNRLHQEGARKNQFKAQLEELRSHVEAQSCTFRPAINKASTGTTGSREATQSPADKKVFYERLYEDSQKNSNKLAKMKMEKSEENAGQWNFTPQRVVSKKIERRYGAD